MNSFNAFLVKGLEIVNLIGAFITFVACTYILYKLFTTGYGSIFYRNEPGAFFTAVPLSLIMTFILHGVISLLVDIRHQLKTAVEQSQ